MNASFGKKKAKSCEQHIKNYIEVFIKTVQKIMLSFYDQHAYSSGLFNRGGQRPIILLHPQDGSCGHCGSTG